MTEGVYLNPKGIQACGKRERSVLGTEERRQRPTIEGECACTIVNMLGRGSFARPTRQSLLIETNFLYAYVNLHFLSDWFVGLYAGLTRNRFLLLI